MCWLGQPSSLRQLEASYTRDVVRLLVVVMMARGIAVSSFFVYLVFGHGRAVLWWMLRSGNTVSVALSGQSINDRDALDLEPTYLAEENANGDFAGKNLQPDAP